MFVVSCSFEGTDNGIGDGVDSLEVVHCFITLPFFLTKSVSLTLILLFLLSTLSLVYEVVCSSEGTDGGRGGEVHTLTVAGCCLPAVAEQYKRYV